MDVGPILDAYRATDQMRRRRYSLSNPGFDPEEVLAAIAQWAEVVEEALDLLAIKAEREGRRPS